MRTFVVLATVSLFAVTGTSLANIGTAAERTLQGD
jgi:hypothetical protein